MGPQRAAGVAGEIGRRDEAVAVAAAGRKGDRGLRQVVRADGDGAEVPWPTASAAT